MKVSPDPLRAAGREHPADVFEEEEPGSRLDEDPARVGPQVALVVFAEALAGEGMRLARDAANDSIHEATPWAAVEGGDIAPQRRWSHKTLLHRADQLAGGEGFPLHETDVASACDCQLNTEVETSSTGAEADDVGWGGT